MTAMGIHGGRRARTSPAAERAAMERRLSLLEEALGVRTRKMQMPLGVTNADRALINARLKYLEMALSVRLRKGAS